MPSRKRPAEIVQVVKSQIFLQIVIAATKLVEKERGVPFSIALAESQVIAQAGAPIAVQAGSLPQGVKLIAGTVEKLIDPGREVQSGSSAQRHGPI